MTSSNSETPTRPDAFTFGGGAVLSVRPSRMAGLSRPSGGTRPRTERCAAGRQNESMVREQVARALLPSVITTDQSDDLACEASVHELGAVRVSTLSCPRLHAYRTPELVRQSDPEAYQLALIVRGRMRLRQHRHDVRVENGGLVLYDSSHPFRACLFADPGPVEIVVASVPRAVLPLTTVQADKLMAVPLPGDRGMGALLACLLTQLGAGTGQMRPPQTTRLGSIALDVIATFLTSGLNPEDGISAETHQQRLTVAIHAFIERNLGDPRLSPPAVAAAHHLSVRYLHRLFQMEGTTVRAWIRGRRLDRCRRDLTDPALVSRPIHSIASRWGFLHAADFSRAFRALYGLTPTEYRKLTAGNHSLERQSGKTALAHDQPTTLPTASLIRPDSETQLDY